MVITIDDHDMILMVNDDNDDDDDDDDDHGVHNHLIAAECPQDEQRKGTSFNWQLFELAIPPPSRRNASTLTSLK
eukprot:7122428-Prorocentrum_lima.AAC.1